MKSKVMDRPLFKGPTVPDDQVENVGIMQGFLDDEDDLESMLGRDEDEEETSEEDQNNESMSRTPRTPEILMNNLRGDMRSMDARVEELADLVGYNAAMDTPEEVLMLLQPVLAKQGIGGLPAGGAAPAMPPAMPPAMGGMPSAMGAMPPEMPTAMAPAAPGAAGIESLMAPPAPPPMDQAPMQMRDGGYVQRFQAGSDEEGVTPATTYPPEMVKYAQEQLMRQPGAGSLKQAVEGVLPTYRDVLGGGDRRTMQGQALMDIAGAGLALASGRNAQGANIAGGSFASQLASAAQGLPAKLGERAAQFQQEERAIKLAALKSAETSVEGQRKLFAQIVKSAGQSPFGKGDWDFAVFNTPDLMQRYAEGKTTPKEDMLVESAITKGQTTKTEFKTDPVTKQVYQVQVPGTLPPFVASAINARKGGGGTSTPTSTATTPTATTPTATTPTATATTTTTPKTGESYAIGSPTGVPGTFFGKDNTVVDKKGNVVFDASIRNSAGEIIDVAILPDKFNPEKKDKPADRTVGVVPPTAPKEVAASTYSKNEPTFFNMAGRGTGPISVAKPFFAKIPLIGQFVDADKEIEATTFLKTGINRVTAALGETERFGSVEKAQILGQLDLLPGLIDRPEAYQQRVVGLDTLLIKAAKELAPTAYNTDLTPATQGDARAKLEQIRQVRSLIGAPPRVNSNADFDILEIGTPFVLPGGKIQIKTAQRPKG
jgi:hypothetical protein